MVRILHAGDFHLDSAFGALTPEQARQRRAESRRMPERMVDWANDHGVQLLLLAGDLFDGDDLSGDTAKLLARALGGFQGQVVIAPGNHDPYTARSAYARTLWPDNVHIFTEDRMQTIPFPQYGCAVHGAAFTAPEETADRVLSGFTAPDDGLVHIGLLHGELTGSDSRYRPLTTAAVAASGLHYLALGHVHGCTGVLRMGSVSYAYCGCPEGRGFDELGDKGFLAGQVSPEGAELHRPALCEADLADLAQAAALGVSAVMQPFVRSADDLRTVRQAMAENGLAHAELFAKVEDQTGLDALPDWMDLCDVVTIARGDLGSSLPLEQLPAAQKHIAALCCSRRKPFLVVTQLLHSMIDHPTPTRAEVLDIYNAVLDGADCLMLTGETAQGRYPLAALDWLMRVAQEAQRAR